MIKTLHKGGLILLTALFSEGAIEALTCLVTDKQKVHGKKAEPPVLLVTQLFSNSVKEATLPGHGRSRGYMESTQETLFTEAHKLHSSVQIYQ